MNVQHLSMELSNIIAKIRDTNKWKSESRIVDESCEEYIKNNIQCVRCKNSNFQKYKPNEKSKDLHCLACGQKYQIKAKSVTQRQINNIVNSNKFKTIGGEYNTTIQHINQSIDYLIVLYEKKSYEVKKNIVC